MGGRQKDNYIVQVVNATVRVSRMVVLSVTMFRVGRMLPMRRRADLAGSGSVASMSSP